MVSEGKAVRRVLEICRSSGLHRLVALRELWSELLMGGYLGDYKGVQ